MYESNASGKGWERRKAFRAAVISNHLKPRAGLHGRFQAIWEEQEPYTGSYNLKNTTQGKPGCLSWARGWLSATFLLLPRDLRKDTAGLSCTPLRVGEAWIWAPVKNLRPSLPCPTCSFYKSVCMWVKLAAQVPAACAHSLASLLPADRGLTVYAMGSTDEDLTSGRNRT